MNTIKTTLGDIKTSIVKIQADQVLMKEDQIKNTSNLKHHIKRTDLLEKLVLVIIVSILGVGIKLITKGESSNEKTMVIKNNMDKRSDGNIRFLPSSVGVGGSKPNHHDDWFLGHQPDLKSSHKR